MKTSEEWTKFQYVLFGNQAVLSKGDWKYVVEQIQLDAYKAGMSEAAEIAGARQYNGVDSYGHAFVEGCKTTQQAILTARDNLKEI